MSASDTIASLASWSRAIPPCGPPLVLEATKEGALVDPPWPLFAARGVCVLGRHSGLCDVTLDHASLSRQHCALALGPDGGTYLCDLGSTHGTFLDGSR